MAAIAHFLNREDDVFRRTVMVRDYANRAKALPERDRAGFDVTVVESFLPPMADSPRRSRPAPPKHVRDVDVLILTVQQVEFKAARAALEIDDPPDVLPDGRPFYRSRIPLTAAGLADPPGHLSVAVTTIGQPYSLHAQQAVDDISAFYRASVWILVGMAAGLAERTRKADVYLPQTVWWYEPGRLTTDRFEPRPAVASRGQMNLQLARFDPAGTRLRDRLAAAIADLPPEERPPDLPPDFRPRISVLSDAVASGDKLLRDGERLARLHEVNQHILLGDQESYGFAFACRDMDWIIARGIADFGDAEKDSSYQYLATTLATHTVLEFLESDYIPPSFVIPNPAADEG